MRFLLIFLFFSFLVTNLQAKNLNFNEALNVIIKRDTYLPIQETEIDSSKTARLSKTLRFLPKIDIGRRWVKDYRTELKTNKLFLSSSINIFKGGSDYSLLKNKRYEVRRKNVGLKRLRLERESNAIKQLINYISTKKRMVIYEKMVKIKTESLLLAQKRYEKGLTPNEDVLRAQVELQNAKASLEDAILNFNSSKQNLKELIGEYEVMTIWPWEKDLLDIKRQNFKLKKFSNHPSIEEASIRVSEEESLKNYYRGLMLPKVDFSYSWNRHKNLGTMKDYEQIGLLTITFSIFDGLSQWSDFQTQGAHKIAAEYTLLRTRRNVEENLKIAESNLETSINTALTRGSTLNLSRTLYKNNSRRYKQGKITFTDLEVEQNRLFRSETLSNDGWAKAHIAFSDYCHAIGQLVANCQ